MLCSHCMLFYVYIFCVSKFKCYPTMFFFGNSGANFEYFYSFFIFFRKTAAIHFSFIGKRVILLLLGGAFMALHTIPEIRQIVSDLARQYGAQRVYLFGSYARGDMTSDSDIDLRIDKGAIRGLAFAGLLGDLEDALDTSVDLISTAGMDTEFLKEIQRDEVLLYESAG